MPPGPQQVLPATTGDGHSVTGHVDRLAAFWSDVLGNHRDVHVYLPPGYALDAERRYPVLYLHDGQNVFDGATAYVHGQEWGVDEAAQQLMAAGEIRPALIVAVDHAGHDRAHEFAPTRDSARDAGGHADAYGRFLLDELKPYIDATYRTRPEAPHTAVGGSSLGGLVTLHLGLTRAADIGALVVMSPSLWWDRRIMLERVSLLPGRLPWRIWLDCGTGEGRDTLRNVRALRALLLQKGWQGGTDLRYVEARDGSHSEGAWAARVPDVLRFLYPPPA